MQILGQFFIEFFNDIGPFRPSEITKNLNFQTLPPEKVILAPGLWDNINKIHFLTKKASENFYDTDTKKWYIAVIFYGTN